MPRNLGPGGRLLRVIWPDHINPETDEVSAEAYQDLAKKDRETLSFFLDGVSSPRAALAALGKYKAARDHCETGKLPASPDLMFSKGIRVGWVASDLVLKSKMDILPQGNDGSNVAVSGHVEIIDGHQLSDTWARATTLLEEHETLGQ